MVDRAVSGGSHPLQLCRVWDVGRVNAVKLFMLVQAQWW